MFPIPTEISLTWSVILTLYIFALVVQQKLFRLMSCESRIIKNTPFHGTNKRIQTICSFTNDAVAALRWRLVLVITGDNDSEGVKESIRCRLHDGPYNFSLDASKYLWLSGMLRDELYFRFYAQGSLFVTFFYDMAEYWSNILTEKKVIWIIG